MSKESTLSLYKVAYWATAFVTRPHSRTMLPKLCWVAIIDIERDGPPTPKSRTICFF